MPSGQDVEEPNRWKITEETGLVLVLVPGGSFLMGAEASRAEPNYDKDARPDESSGGEVDLDAFLISKYEMTQAQWRRIRGRNPSYFRAPQYRSWNVGPTNPVEQVSWEDCQEMLRALGLELPTEAQWEYACRGGEGPYSPWWSGAEVKTLRGIANLPDQAFRRGKGQGEIVGWDDGFPVHAPVGSLRANRFGLHDVHGNVWEWCQDGSVNDYSAFDPEEGSGLRRVPRARYRVNRGGSFNLTALNARSAARFHRVPAFRDAALGFRPSLKVRAVQ